MCVYIYTYIYMGLFCSFEFLLMVLVEESPKPSFDYSVLQATT